MSRKTPRKTPKKTDTRERWDAELPPCRAPSLGLDDAVELGRLGKVWGLRGDQRLQLHNPEIGSLIAQPLVYLGVDRPERAAAVTLVEKRGGKLLIRLAGIDGPEKARALVGQGIWLPRDALPALPDEEFYLHDLIGSQVIDQNGVALGEVRDFLDNGAQDVLIVRGVTEEVLIPLVEPIVREIDLENRIILVDFHPAE